jgi:hypothetical protein
MSTSDATPNAFLALLCKDADGFGLMPSYQSQATMGGPASNPSIVSPLLASTSPEDLLRKSFFAWAEIPSRKGAPKLQIALL